jgi:hypothetical protein
MPTQALFFHNPKGGVGKSVVCRTAIQYALDHQHSFVAFDSDRNNPDCYRLYKSEIPVKLAIFSESTKHEDSANAIFNEATKQDVIVNLPAQVHQPLKEWFDKNDLLTLANDIGLTFHLCFVLDAGYDSLKLLHSTFETYGDQVRYTIIRNYGRADDFESLTAHKPLQKLATRYNAAFMDFPLLMGSVVRNRLDAESLSFGAALHSDSFGLIEKQRIKKFLNESYAAFEQAGVFQHERTPERA